MAHQIRWYEGRQQGRKERIETGRATTAVLNQAIEDVDLLIGDINLYIERARQAEKRMYDLQMEHGRCGGVLAKAREDHADCMHTVNPLRRKLKNARKILGEFEVKQFSAREQEILKDIMRDG